MKKLFAIPLLLCGLLLAATNSAYAVEYGGIGGRPANPQQGNERSESIFIYTLKPGQSASDAVQIINNTPTERTISVYPVDSTIASGGTFSCAQKAEKITQVGGWITLEQSTVTVKPQTNVKIPFTITAPQNADVGEHNGCIAVQDASEDATKADDGGVLLSFRSAIRVAVTVPGKIIKKLTIDSVAVTSNDAGKLVVSPTVNNEGNVSLDTTLTTTIRSFFGTEQATSKSTYPVLSRSKASWNFELDKPFWGGWYTAEVTAAYSDDSNATLGQKDKTPKQVKRSSSYVFVAPQPAALAAELGILALIVGLLAWLLAAAAITMSAPAGLTIRSKKPTRSVRLQRRTKSAGNGLLKRTNCRHRITWKPGKNCAFLHLRRSKVIDSQTFASITLEQDQVTVAGSGADCFDGVIRH